MFSSCHSALVRSRIALVSVGIAAGLGTIASALPPELPRELGESTDSLAPLSLLRSSGMTRLHELHYVRSSAALRERAVELQFAALDPLRPALDLDLFDGTTVRFTRTGYEVRGAGDYTWRGAVTSGENIAGSATISVRGGVAAGLFLTPNGAVYELRAIESGAQLLSELNQDRYRECAEPPRPDLPAPGRLARSAEPGKAFADTADFIDMLVLYTDDARIAAGGVAAIEATVQSAIDLTNSAYANSQITTRMRLARMQEITYTETGDAGTDLDWLTADGTVASLRDQYGADVVSLIVQTSNYCGVGWLMTAVEASFADYAYNVVLRECAAGNLTLAHETGHNQGCNHDPANSGPESSYTFAYGHFVDGSFRTVMSYTTQCTTGCPKAPHFSNPAILYAGASTGVEGQRDNHQTINSTALTVANFRAAVSVLGAPSSFNVVKRARKAATVSWIDGSNSETGFNAYRWTGTDWVFHQTFPGSTTSGKLVGLKPGKRYTFALTATDGASESPASNQITFKTAK